MTCFEVSFPLILPWTAAGGVWHSGVACFKKPDWSGTAGKYEKQMISSDWQSTDTDS